ncbi:hypothetical protein BH10ACI1_BH10ACI1_28180 [soil metagenome]
MKKIYLSGLIIGLLFISVSAQEISKPTLTPAEPNEEQQKQINAAIKLHDQ